MGERSSYRPGTFCWIDLATPDVEAAGAFYAGLFGWVPESIDIGDGATYTIMRLDGEDVGAVFSQPGERREAGVPPAWDSYVSVEDADAMAAKARELGGEVLVEPFDVMGDLGRMSYARDPQGAQFAMWQPGSNIGAGLVNTAGSLTLNQLNTSDPEAAGRFYSELFGWSVELQGQDAGQHYWGLFNHGSLNGGMMQLPDDQAAPPHWLVYLGAEDLDLSTRRVKELGGQVVVPPMVIPSGGRFAVARDPQGAIFAMFQGRFDD